MAPPRQTGFRPEPIQQDFCELIRARGSITDGIDGDLGHCCLEDLTFHVYFKLPLRQTFSEGGAAAVSSDEPVVGSSEVRRLEERVRELERLLGRKTMENEILREALAKSQAKKPISRPLSLPKGGFR